MNIHSKSYPHQTTLAVPGYVRPPNTLHEHFLANPLGCSNYPEFANMAGDVDPKTMMAKIIALLDAPAILSVGSNSPVVPWMKIATGTLGELIEYVVRVDAYSKAMVYLDDGRVIKEWRPTS